MTAKKPATASYWVHGLDPTGVPDTFMWNCESCPVVGIEKSEAETVRVMNDHVETEHADRPYATPPIPE